MINLSPRLCCRGGWKGKPVVVLGRKEDVPMGLLPLVSIVARPVKHVRLVTALLKATALMRFKAQVCCSLLNADPLAYFASGH